MVGEEQNALLAGSASFKLSILFSFLRTVENCNKWARMKKNVSFVHSQIFFLFTSLFAPLSQILKK